MYFLCGKILFHFICNYYYYFFLFKDEHGFKKNQLYDSLHNSIRIHHAFAEKATDYTKKQYVFRLHTADHAVYLFQTR